jgi:hypothetical protein
VSRAELGLALSFAICGLLACGGDDDSPGQVGTERPPPMDAAVVEPDADLPDDAGEDVPVPDAGPPSDAAAPIPCDDEACEAMSDACNAAACNHDSEECEVSARDDGTHCGDPTSTECSAPNVCNAGTCVANDLPAGSPCGQTGVVCRLDDQCDGGGLCVPSGLAPEGTACGSQTVSECDAPDTCDGSGACQPNHASVDTQCGNIGVPCRYDDYCDGSGSCDVQGPWSVSNCPPGHTSISGLGCSCGSLADDESCTPQICINGTCTMTMLDENYSCGADGTLCCDSTQTCGSCI